MSGEESFAHVLMSGVNQSYQFELSLCLSYRMQEECDTTLTFIVIFIHPYITVSECTHLCTSLFSITKHLDFKNSDKGQSPLVSHYYFYYTEGKNRKYTKNHKIKHKMMPAHPYSVSFKNT